MKLKFLLTIFALATSAFLVGERNKVGADNRDLICLDTVRNVRYSWDNRQKCCATAGTCLGITPTCDPGYKPDLSIGQCLGNSFGCVWSNIVGCKAGPDTCDSGFKANEGICSSVQSGESACKATVDTCIPSIPCDGKCDATTQVCDELNQTCRPNKSVLASCPNGYREPLLNLCPGFCCKATGFLSGACDFRPDADRSIPIIPSCDDWRKKYYIVPKDSCPTDASVTYEFQGGVCVPTKKTKVFLCLESECETAIGNIKTDPAGFISFYYGYGLMLAGLALIITLIAIGYKVLTSQGKPESLQAAREMFASLIGGLILILFSFVILQAVGFSIFKLPGFY